MLLQQQSDLGQQRLMFVLFWELCGPAHEILVFITYKDHIKICDYRLNTFKHLTKNGDYRFTDEQVNFIDLANI